MSGERRPPTEPSTSEHELLISLVQEGRRREGRFAEGTSRAIGGGEGAPEALEELRAEAHALKGAAAVVGQPRLFELAKALEDLLLDAIAGGSLSQRRAEAITRAAHAYVEGAEAAASGAAEPDSIRASMDDLAA
jgi:HPt (histidine-containing phosphotransfer) domain-containing protein